MRQRILFLGDVVGEPGLRFLESWLPWAVQRYNPDFIVANGENLSLHPGERAGMSQEGIERLLALGVDAITGGNHSFDGPWELLEHPRVLRPLNWGLGVPGRGVLRLVKGEKQLCVTNLISRTAFSQALDPVEALERLLAEGAAPLLVDYHGESVFEKLGVAFLFSGRVAALLGTHTHVPTLDVRILPGGTAYVSDVGMVGPGEGMQGYHPDSLAWKLRTRLVQPGGLLAWAQGPVERGAVYLELEEGQAIAIQRV